MTENIKIWNAVKQPPPTALKTIAAGRLKGKSDINPQWRYQVLTEQFGPCGFGWKYEIDRLWNEPGDNGQVFAFAMVSLYVKTDSWSLAIPGIGGSMLIANERSGPYSSDEAYKMAVTDALSVACKMIGVAADVYAGKWDGERYAQEEEHITTEQTAEIRALIHEVKANEPAFLKFFKLESVEKMAAVDYQKAIKMLESKRKPERQPGDEDIQS
jgi:hypothetical protein